MADYQAVNDLGVVQIETTELFQQVDPGLAGVAYLNAAANQSLQSYASLNDVVKDYPAGTYLYAAASAYFNNPESPLFQVINYVSSANSSNTTATPTINSAGSSTSSSSSNSGSASNAGSSAPVINVPNPSDADNAVAAVKKYFSAAWEHLVIHVTDQNKQVAVEVAQFVEAQNNKLVYLEVPAAAPANGSGPDFSWLAPLVSSASNKGLLSTSVQSLPEATSNDNDFNLDGALLSVFANANPGTNPQFTTGLEGFANVKPQDFYNFSRDDLDKYYTPYNVWTYAYRNGVPMFTTNYSLSGYQLTPMFIRDSIVAQVKKAILNLFLQNGGIQYNTAGVHMITDQIQLVLDAMTKAGLITNAKVDEIDVDKISEAVKATGHLNGLGWTWEPVFGINDARFHQSIDLPELH